MDFRVKFQPGQQKEFIEEVIATSGLKVEDLSRIVGIVPRSFRDWRREKLNMSLHAAEAYCKNFDLRLPESRSVLIDRWKTARHHAAQVGGKACFIKFGSPGTLEGRSRGGSRALEILRKRGLIPPRNKFSLPRKFTPELAEYVGILLGDGGITKDQCTITLNSEADKDYIQFVISLGKTLFGIEPKTFYRKDCRAVNVYHTGINLVSYLTKIGLKTGNKVRQQVGVPAWIQTSKDFKVSCLRGLMDTDGGIFAHRYRVNSKLYRYTKACFSNRSLPLLSFVSNTLEELGFTPKVIETVANKKVWLYNMQEVKGYLTAVGTHNPRLLRAFGG